MTFDEYVQGLNRLIKLRVQEEQVLENSIDLDDIEEIAEERVQIHYEKYDKINKAIDEYNLKANKSNFRIRLSMLLSELQNVYGGRPKAMTNLLIKANKKDASNFDNLNGVITIELMDDGGVAVADYSNIAINSDDWCIDGHRVKDFLQITTQYGEPVLTLKDKKYIDLLNVNIDLTKPYMHEFGFLKALQRAMARQDWLNKIITDDINKPIDEAGY